MTLAHADLDALAAALAVHRVDEDPNDAGGRPRLAGTSAYFWVRTKWERAVVAAAVGSSWVAANASIRPSSSASGTAIP
ncbi:MAG: hypothetical protein R3C32_07280 [Chloroflexota bacterium]